MKVLDLSPEELREVEEGEKQIQDQQQSKNQTQPQMNEEEDLMQQVQARQGELAQLTQ